MDVKVIGISDSNFKGSDGTQVTGTNLYVTHVDRNVVGLKAQKFFISQRVSVPQGLAVGADVRLDFNQYGKVAGMSVIDKK